MGELLEATEERLVFKAYASAAIDSQTEPALASDPAASGGQILRHVDHSFSLAKEAYGGDEVRTDKMKPMQKHGTRRVTASINGLLSGATYADLFEACTGGTWSASAVALNESDMTSVAADESDSTFTFGGGDPVSEGLRVGDLVAFTSLSETANNGVNFLVLGFSGASNRVMEVYPAPVDMTADSAFSLTTVGRSLYMPTSGHTKRKFAVEIYNSDGDISRVFTEGRFAGFGLTLAPNDDARVSFSGMWRNRVTLETSAAPFFTSPTAETTSDIISSMDGLLRMNGETVGGVTGLSINFNRAPTMPAQINRDGLAAGVLQANAVITGEFTVFLDSVTWLQAFDNGTEFEIVAMLAVSNDPAAAAITVHLPRVKINSNTETTIDGAKALQCGFEAARYLGTAPGVQATNIRITDTLVS